MNGRDIIKIPTDDVSYDTLNTLNSKKTFFITPRFNYSFFLGGMRAGNSQLLSLMSAKNLTPDDTGFVEFVAQKNGRLIDSDWKIHLSIHPEDLSKAWDLISEMLLIHGDLQHFKVTRLNAANNTALMVNALLNVDQMQDGQDKSNLAKYKAENRIHNKVLLSALEDNVRVTKGMQITIYVPKGKENEIQSLLNNIEKILFDNRIRPGVVHFSDEPLGLYASTRQEVRNNKYLEYRDAPFYKDSKSLCPFEKIEINNPEVVGKQIDCTYLDYDVMTGFLYEKVNYFISLESLMLKSEADDKLNTQYLSEVINSLKEYCSYWHILLEGFIHYHQGAKDFSSISTVMKKVTNLELPWSTFKEKIDAVYSSLLNQSEIKEIIAELIRIVPKSAYDYKAIIEKANTPVVVHKISLFEEPKNKKLDQPKGPSFGRSKEE